MRTHPRLSVVVGAFSIALAMSVPQLRAQDATASASAIERIESAYQAALIALSERARKAQLYNAAESLLVEAYEWGLGAGEFKERRAAIQALRVARMKGPAKEPYGAFLTSTAYTTERSKLAKRRVALDRKTIARARAVARACFKAAQREDGKRALAIAMRIDAASVTPHGKAEKAAWKELMDARREALSLDRLVLGPAIPSRALTVADLRGKVVVWRSQSL